MKAQPVPCLIATAGTRHGPHPWSPIVADPRHDRVLHVLPDAVWCPGYDRPT